MNTKQDDTGIPGWLGLSLPHCTASIQKLASHEPDKRSQQYSNVDQFPKKKKKKPEEN